MLSRTADSLYWLARYVERADFTARLLEAAARLAALPAPEARSGRAFESAVAISDAREAFYERHAQASEDTVRAFLALDPDNPSSIRSCLAKAQANARAARTALTSEVREQINEAVSAATRWDGRELDASSASRLLDELKSALRNIDGAVHHTQLRNDGYCFLRIGAAIERADNTARILDVKYHLLLPDGEPVGGGLDYFEWTTILREVSALNAYRWVYRDSIRPWLVADLLILNRQMPRSLLFCSEEIAHHLDRLADGYSRRGPAQRLASRAAARLGALTIDEIFQAGLHEFVAGFISDTAALSDAVAEQYLF